MFEKFKVDEKKEQKTEKEKKKFIYLLDEDQVEIKRLVQEDVEEVVKVMRKCAFDVTEKEVSHIIGYNMSFGAYVNRMLIGVGLSWPAKFDIKQKKIVGGEPNALYLEDPAVLLAYEGRGIRRILLKEREKEAKNRNFSYTVAYLSEDLPKGSIEDYIKESGSQLEKLYLSENYEFLRTERGIIAIKKL
jgi:GNAT superfamily N-acetyltransferase